MPEKPLPAPGAAKEASLSISAAIACFNEAHFLAQSLPRLSFCDEILVVDLGSQDNSAGVAGEHGARVLHHEWAPFRERIVQYMAAQASHDWILFSDPDLMFPDGIGVRIRALLQQADPHRLGMLYLPMRTCYGTRPLRRGQKGSVRGYRALIHRERVVLSTLLHHKGVLLKEGCTGLCLRPDGEQDLIQHYWINNWADAMHKARRYLPYEGETRQSLGQKFSWKGALRETAASLASDLRSLAFLDWRATQVMFFQGWYTWKANLALREYERSRARTGTRP
jgi:glycosyltransferase involved in cell wall biosynthesis